MPVTLPSLEFQVAHGASKFLRADKVAAMKRQDKGTCGLFYKIGLQNYLPASSLPCSDRHIIYVYKYH